MKINKDEESRNNVTVPVYRSTAPLVNVLDSTASCLQDASSKHRLWVLLSDVEMS